MNSSISFLRELDADECKAVTGGTPSDPPDFPCLPPEGGEFQDGCYE